ncbi:MAG: DUF3817 domain-containing protein [Bryobacteraceae bacterium]|nr:DUF3817 domain-containing protein [Bryobacteraceae bacterium]
MLIPIICAAPLFAFYLPRWSQRLQGAENTADIRQPAERSESARLRLFALAEGTSFLVLLGIAVPLKHLGGHPELVRIMGPIHGALFVLYVTGVMLARRPLRWSISRVAWALVAGVIPGGAFVFEAMLRREEQTVKELSARPDRSLQMPRRS